MVVDSVTHMVVLLRHIDQVLRVRTSSTCECDGQFTQAKSLPPRGLELARRPLWHFATASVPLLAAGQDYSWACAGSGGQAGLHRQAIRFADPKSSPAISARRRYHQSVGRSGSAALREPASRLWLNARASAASVANTNMCMIVCRWKKCRRFTAGWCQTTKLGTSPWPK